MNPVRLIFSVSGGSPMRHNASVTVVEGVHWGKGALSHFVPLRRGAQREVDDPFETSTFLSKRQT